VDEWLPAVRPPKVRPSTWLSYQLNVEGHIVPALGRVPLQRLTPPQLTAFYRTLLDGDGAIVAAVLPRRPSATFMVPYIPRSRMPFAGAMSPATSPPQPTGPMA